MFWLWLLVAFVCVAMMGTLGAWIASQKNRDASEGLILGVAFGPLGVLIEALLPTITKAERQERIQSRSMVADDSPAIDLAAIRPDRRKEVPRAIDQIEL